MAHAADAGLAIERGSGHFPFHDDPARFIDIKSNACWITTGARRILIQAALRALLRQCGEANRHRLGRHPPAAAERHRVQRTQRYLITTGPLGSSLSYSRAMAIEVSVLRASPIQTGNFGNPLG